MYSLYIGINGGEMAQAGAGVLEVTYLPAPRTDERRYVDGDRCRIMSSGAQLVLKARITDDTAVDMLLGAGMSGDSADFRYTVGRFVKSGTGTVIIERIYASQLVCEAVIRIVI